MRTVARSACPYDCPDGCGLLVEVDEGRAVAVRGDPAHPWSRGSLCAKMNRYQETVHSPARLETPLVRVGPKGAGAFRRAKWDEALALIADRWQEVIGRHGAEAILPYSYSGPMGLVQRNAGHAFFHALGASRLVRSICAPAKDAAWKAVMGSTLALDPEEVRESDVVVLWSLDAVATHVHFAARVAEARRLGAKVVAVDTYASATTRLADRVLLVRPGSDGALALGVVHLLARDGLIDRQFVDTRVQGFDELAREVLPEWTPQRTAEVTGLAVRDVTQLAAMLGRARAPFFRIGSGLSRYGNGSLTVRAILCIPAVLGSWTRRGGGALCSTTTSGAFDLSWLTCEDLQPRPARAVNMSRLGHALTELEGPRVMSLYVYGSNPAAVAPDQNAVLAGLAREDLFTVVHERFLTDTARFADVVLPATSSLEQADLYRSYGHYVIQRTRPVIPPIGESRSNWDTFRALARAMGIDEPLFALDAEAVVDRLLDTPAPLREGVDREALDAGRPVALNVPPQAKSHFLTPSGKIEILSSGVAELLPRYRPTHVERRGEASRPGRLWLVTAPSVYGLNSSFLHERDDLRARAGPMVLRMGPDDARTRGLGHGDLVVAWNERGEVTFTLDVTADVPQGLVVAPGVRRLEDAPGGRNVNALTSQRLTDEAGGSTFYDTAVEVRAAGNRDAPG